MPGRRVSPEDRRDDLLRAAYDVAARRGVGGLTVRAVAARAAVSHGTVLFHFKRQDQLVASLLERVVDASITLRIPDSVQRIARPAARMEAVLRAEMTRLSGEPRSFRLFLEYWTLGVRHPAIRRKVSAALDRYRGTFRAIAVDVAPEPDGVAAVAVSLVHGCALQAVIDPAGFSVQQHLDAATRLVDGFAMTSAA